MCVCGALCSWLLVVLNFMAHKHDKMARVKIDCHRDERSKGSGQDEVFFFSVVAVAKERCFVQKAAELLCTGL